ncbi:MAG: indolepyruvate oxidoreductase subunit beta [Clostridiales bacterium 38-18]|nr:MAG: indolepyruvate oxidoreductase subunit beta [Clostridiales bacterium 38-18]
MSEIKNILLCGVGGQGIILASKILATGLIKAGYDVKMSEVHGMAQRGGSVTTQVRYGEKVYSPIIGKGQADVLVSFETMETPRWIDYVKPEGKVVINAYQIPSATILSGAAEYPEGVIEDLSSKVNTTVFKAAELAEELGNIKTMNVIIVGALVKAMGLESAIDWTEIIKENVKEKFIDVNIKAFEIGINQVN